MKALVAGATGLVGSELVNQLILSGQYRQIYVFVRRIGAFSHALIQEVLFDYEAPEALPDKVNDVFICLGTTRRKAGSKEAFRRVDFDYVAQIGDMAEEMNASSINFVSSMGASVNTNNFYLKVKGEAEAYLATKEVASVTFVRPSLILGKRNEVRVGESFGKLLMKPLMFMMKGRLVKYKPITATHIAKALLWSIDHPHRGVQIIENDGLYSIVDQLA